MSLHKFCLLIIYVFFCKGPSLCSIILNGFCKHNLKELYLCSFHNYVLYITFLWIGTIIFSFQDYGIASCSHIFKMRVCCFSAKHFLQIWGVQSVFYLLLERFLNSIVGLPILYVTDLVPLPRVVRYNLKHIQFGHLTVIY